MWSFKDALKYMFGTYNSFYKIQEGATAFNKDIIDDFMRIIKHKGPKNMCLGIHDVMTGNGLIFWLNALSTILTLILNLFIFKFFGFSMLLSLCFSGLINAFIMQVMYNHRQSWSNILYKLYAILIAVGIILEVFSIVSGVLGIFTSFSVVGIMNILATVVRIMAYGLVLNGLTQ